MDNEEFMWKFEEAVLPHLSIQYVKDKTCWGRTYVQLLYKGEVVSEAIVDNVESI